MEDNNNDFGDMILTQAIMGGFNVVTNLFNSWKQRSQQKKQQNEMSQNSIDQQYRQFKFQTQIQRDNFKQQLEMQIRQYELVNNWPLTSDPIMIANYLQNSNVVPLYVIIAPIQANSDVAKTISKNLSPVWDRVISFIQNEFPQHSKRPIIIGKYKNNFPVAPEADISIINSGLQSMPVLYIAPSAIDKENVLKFTVAAWGINSAQPVVNTFEFNFEKMFIDQIRIEAEEYQRRLDSGMLEKGVNPRIEKNIDIFQTEKKLLAKGNEFEYLNKTLNIYKGIAPSDDTYLQICNHLTPQLQTFVTISTDTYYTLGYRYPSVFSDVMSRINIDEESKKMIFKEYNIKILEEYKVKEIPEITNKSESSNISYLNYFFQISGHIAKLDGRVSEKEAEYLRKIMQELNLSESERKAMNEEIKKGRDKKIAVYTSIDKLKESLKNNPQKNAIVEKLLNDFYKLSLIDGINDNKKDLLCDIGLLLDREDFVNEKLI